MTFDEAFTRVIGHEGGYVADSRDPGGETKFGISKRAYPHVDIAALTLDDAKRIYRRDYWSAVRADEMPPAVRFDLFDLAVNSGVAAAARMLQRAAGVTVDAVIGPQTMAAVRAADPERLRSRIAGHRLMLMTDLATWPVFGRGWARRVASNLLEG
jgi:lysozyme family protein